MIEMMVDDIEAFKDLTPLDDNKCTGPAKHQSKKIFKETFGGLSLAFGEQENRMCLCLDLWTHH